ncbi:hypothetical protein HRUBRA_01056 [Pseudohaliea rubra DSM 19751]|uniref:Uncharacterized protein n=2 Tax=Pseudohaliea TaxID=1341120 RepID=A0A095VSM2_9GAMM|nr:hypothetical protein HRUBRA_01056 [Pseudohaliea rubra DSM 19751]
MFALLVLAALAQPARGEERTIARNPIDVDPATRLSDIRLRPGFEVSRILRYDDITGQLDDPPAPGLHFGFPHRYGEELVDDDYPTDKPAAAFTASTTAYP